MNDPDAVDDSLSDLDDRISRLTPAEDDLQRFWAVASRYARVGDMDVLIGTPWGQAVAPPAWSFGSTPEMADDLLGLVLAGAKTATSSLKQEYDDDSEPLPKANDLSIVLDGAGRPRALIRTTQVLLTRFGDLTAQQAAAEGEGDLSLDYWRQAHRRFWEAAGHTITDDSLVVWERFKLLHAA